MLFTKKTKSPKKITIICYMKKIIILILSSIFCLFVPKIIKSQDYIKTVPVLRKQSSYDFTNEWQYISTDLYLFNGNRFNSLLSRIQHQKKRNKKDKNKSTIENILVTAQLNGIAGYEDIIYPIFNFKVTEDESGKYTVQATTNEVIRIIDNFPISSINDYIGAKIKIDVITDKNRSLIYLMIASQLQNISAIKDNPTDAALQLVGEFGKLMQKDAQGEEYHFESTIRLYEEQDFNKRFHSLNIFVFAPSKMQGTGFDTTDIATFIDTTKNPIINRDVLERHMDYSSFPCIVTVNYKSKYIPEVPDEINFEVLKIRKAKNETNYRNRLINKDIYLQENKLLDFLEIFAQFKLDVNNYELDYKTKITEDFSIIFFLIIQDLLHLKYYFKRIDLENSGDPVYENEFRNIYESLIIKAEIYLETDNNLRNIKDLVSTLWKLENTESLNLDSLNREEYLHKLQAVDMPQREKNSEEVTTINDWINRIEKLHFEKIYKTKLAGLKQKEINTETYAEVIEFQNTVSNTNCVLCREQVSAFTDNFISEYNEYLRKIAYKNLSEKIILTNDLLYDLTKNQYTIALHLMDDYSEFPPHIQLINDDFLILVRQKDELYVIIRKDYSSSGIEEINDISNKITSLSETIKNGFDNICNKEPSLCRE